MHIFNGYVAKIYTINKKGLILVHSIKRGNCTPRTKKLIFAAAACFIAKQEKEKCQFYGVKIDNNIQKGCFYATIDAANLAAMVYYASQPIDEQYIFNLMHAQKIGKAVNFWHNDFFKINYNQRIFNKEKLTAYSIMKKNRSIRAEKNRLALFSTSKKIIPKKLIFDFKITEKEDHFIIEAS